MGTYFFQRLMDGKGIPVAPVGGQILQGMGSRQNPGFDENGSPFYPSWKTRTVITRTML
jgi:hypothetical protein